jgi:hypothetical protein
MAGMAATTAKATARAKTGLAIRGMKILIILETKNLTTPPLDGATRLAGG